MARQRISRNAPCPCGSGKKYKHCCHGKDVAWSARAEAPRRPVLPRMVSKPSAMSFGVFGVVDAKLKAIAKAHPNSAVWQGLVERLSEATSPEDRIEAYKAIRDAKVVPSEAADYLILWALQWMPTGSELAGPDMDDEDFDEEMARLESDKETLDQLRKVGVDDLAELFVSNRLEFDRRHERGRQFFYGPPEEVLAQSLRARGIIE